MEIEDKKNILKNRSLCNTNDGCRRRETGDCSLICVLIFQFSQDVLPIQENRIRDIP